MTHKLISNEFYKWYISLSDEKAEEFVRALKKMREQKVDLITEESENDYLIRSLISGHKMPSCKSKQEVEKIKCTDNRIYNLLEKVSLMLRRDSEIFCFKDTDFVFAGCNDKFIEFGKFNSAKSVIGHTDFEMPWEEETSFYRQLDKGTLGGERYNTLMPLRVSDGEKAYVLQTKYPLKDLEGFNRGIVIKMKKLNDINALKKFALIENTALVSSSLSKYVSDKYFVKETYFKQLSEIESLCLFYVIRGKTAKEIGKFMNRSPKTIEKHLEILKIKLSCCTKSELIEKSLEMGFMYIIPKSILTHCFGEIDND